MPWEKSARLNIPRAWSAGNDSINIIATYRGEKKGKKAPTSTKQSVAVWSAFPNFNRCENVPIVKRSWKRGAARINLAKWIWTTRSWNARSYETGRCGVFGSCKVRAKILAIGGIAISKHWRKAGNWESVIFHFQGVLLKFFSLNLEFDNFFTSNN